MKDFIIRSIDHGGWVISFHDKSFACWRWAQVIGLLKESDVSFDPSLERDKHPKNHETKHVTARLYPTPLNQEICELELQTPGYLTAYTALCRTKEEMIDYINNYIWEGKHE